jgi:hypothetical protein
MSRSFKNMGRRLYHVVRKKLGGTGPRRAEWRESGAFYLGLPVHTSLIKTSANESLHGIIEAMLGGSNNSRETGLAIHLNTRTQKRRQVHSKRDHRQGVELERPFATNNRTDRQLDVLSDYQDLSRSVGATTSR